MGGMNMEEKMYNHRFTIYETEDGRQFLTPEDAAFHEKYIAQRKKEDACAGFRRSVPFKMALGPLVKWTQGVIRATVFRITNEEELKLFCDAYSYWDSRFCDFETRKRGPYPKEYIHLSCSGIVPDLLLEREALEDLGHGLCELAGAWDKEDAGDLGSGVCLRKYRFDYIDGMTLRIATFCCDARNVKEAKERLYAERGDFDHSIKNILEDGVLIFEG